MRLLKIGTTTINLDLVIELEDRGDQIDVLHAVVNNDGEPLLTSVEGEQAAALRRWIALNAEDLSGLEEGSTGEPLGDPPPYVSRR